MRKLDLQPLTDNSFNKVLLRGFKDQKISEILTNEAMHLPLLSIGEVALDRHKQEKWTSPQHPFFGFLSTQTPIIGALD